MSTLSPFRLKIFMLKNLPLAWVSGLSLESLTNERASVSLKYGFFTKNPFKSIYFACLCMAGELASGIICIREVNKMPIKVSMLVTSMGADFYKKAIGKVIFTCQDGEEIRQEIKKAVESKGPTQLWTTSVGMDSSGAKVAELRILWSFKAKS